MANKWAIQNGNWSDGSTWNDGVVPTADDDVYANGHTIALTNAVTVNNLCNTQCPETGLSGGCFTLPNGGSITITANLFCGSEILVKYAYNAVNQVSIIGNIVSLSSAFAVKVYMGSSVNIVGNVSEFAVTQYGTVSYTVTITGSVTARNGVIIQSEYYSASPNLNVIGELILYTNPSTKGNISVNGKIKIVGSYILNRASTTLQTITIDLQESDNIFPIIGTVVMTETPNILYNIPAENDVRNGVSYMGNKVGKLDIPQESVVLEGYEYDNKIGSLSVFQGNIINLTEQEVNRVKNCATVSTVQKCFEDFKEE